MKNTKVVSAFPGCGKTYFYNTYKNFTISDSDSSTFDKKDFPKNYITHIKELLEKGENDYIFVSSHEEVRQALIKEGIEFTLVYPEKHLKSVYLERYKKRGSPDTFISMMDTNFNKFVDDCANMNSELVTKIPLTVASETLVDVLV